MYSLLTERVQKGKNKLAAQRESRAGHEVIMILQWKRKHLQGRSQVFSKGRVDRFSPPEYSMLCA